MGLARNSQAHARDTLPNKSRPEGTECPFARRGGARRPEIHARPNAIGKSQQRTGIKTGYRSCLSSKKLYVTMRQIKFLAPGSQKPK
jgi:hypothetical protein